MADKQTVDFYNAEANAYVDLVQQQPQDPALPAFLKALSKSDHVLDLGCGPGHSAATMREHGLIVDAVDASAEMIRLANENFNLDARQAQFTDLNAQEIYDGVWANFSLLHAAVEELPLILRAIARALKPGGFFHIAMKTGEGTARDRLGRFYAYYSSAELEEMVGRLGFERVNRLTGELSGLAGDVEPWVSLLFRKC